MRATVAIERQHRNIRQLCTMVRSHGLSARRSLWPQFQNDLVSHFLVEERLIYSIVAKVAPNTDVGEEHRTMRSEVALLADLRMDDGRFDHELEKLEATLVAHFAEEEQVILPLIDRSLSSGDNVELGARIRNAYQNALEAGATAARRAPRQGGSLIERRAG